MFVSNCYENSFECIVSYYIVHLNRRNAFDTELRQFKESNSFLLLFTVYFVYNSSRNVLSYTLLFQLKNMVHSLALPFYEHSFRLPQSY